MFLYSTYSMQLAAISIAPFTMCGSKLIQDWQVHNLLVNVAKLGGNNFNCQLDGQPRRVGRRVGKS